MVNVKHGSINRARRMLVVLACAASCLVAGAVMAEDVIIRAAKLYVGDGRVIENGGVLIRDGKITAVGAGLTAPAGARVITIERGTITPGLIDANALIEGVDLISRDQNRAQPRDAASRSLPNEERTRGFTRFFASLNEDGRPDPFATCDDPADCDDHTLHALNFGHDQHWVPCPDPTYHDTLDPQEACPLCSRPPMNMCAHCLMFVAASQAGAEAFASGVLTNVSRTEASSEVVPHTRVLDSLNLRSADFHRLASEGVTTVFAAPDTAAVFGPRGAIVRTGGALRQRIVVADGPVQAALGTDSFRIGGGNSAPSGNFVSVRTRRPNSRMGVMWVFRKTLVDTRKIMEGEVPFGIDVPSPEAARVLAGVLNHEIPIRVHARTLTDITIAIEQCRAFGVPFTLLDALEGYKVADLLKEAEVPVIYGPITMDGSELVNRTESDEYRLTTIRTLLDHGVPTALSARHLREEDGLARQAMYAMRTGLTRDEALRAVTLTPAEILGIADQVGTLETGKRGDLVIWSGEPFEASSSPQVVVIGGQVVVDRRPK